MKSINSPLVQLLLVATVLSAKGYRVQEDQSSGTYSAVGINPVTGRAVSYPCDHELVPVPVLVCYKPDGTVIDLYELELPTHSEGVKYPPLETPCNNMPGSHKENKEGHISCSFSNTRASHNGYPATISSHTHDEKILSSKEAKLSILIRSVVILSVGFGIIIVLSVLKSLVTAYHVSNAETKSTLKSDEKSIATSGDVTTATGCDPTMDVVPFPRIVTIQYGNVKEYSEEDEI